MMMKMRDEMLAKAANWHLGIAATALFVALRLLTITARHVLPTAFKSPRVGFHHSAPHCIGDIWDHATTRGRHGASFEMKLGQLVTIEGLLAAKRATTRPAKILLPTRRRVLLLRALFPYSWGNLQIRHLD